jgi:hypothetical protein
MLGLPVYQGAAMTTETQLTDEQIMNWTPRQRLDTLATMIRCVMPAQEGRPLTVTVPDGERAKHFVLSEFPNEPLRFPKQNDPQIQALIALASDPANRQKW